MATAIVVQRNDLADARIVELACPALDDGQVRLQIGSFALTANNVTVGISGNLAGYWQHFPLPPPDGIVPAWGFATIAESRVAGLSEGTELWGYLPMAQEWILRPEQLADDGFLDTSPSRKGLPQLYNWYLRTEADPPAVRAIGDARSLFFPLLLSGYLLADWLAEQDFRGVEQVVIASASSKTGLGLAHLVPETIKRRVGLTSPANRSFLEAFGCFDEITTYDKLETVDNSLPTLFADMAGSIGITSRLHRHFGDNLKASIAVGLTHWEETGSLGLLPGPQPERFMVPEQIARREAQWGPAELRHRADAACIDIFERLKDRVNIRRVHGPEQVRKAWVDLVKGRIPPGWGLVCSFGEDG